MSRFLHQLHLSFVAVIVHHGQKQRKEERAYFSLRFQKESPECGGKHGNVWQEQEAEKLHFHLYAGSRGKYGGREQEVEQGRGTCKPHPSSKAVRL